MKIKIRKANGEIFVVDKCSKSMLVEDFRLKVEDSTGIRVNEQRLLFRGKQLEDGCDLMDYKIEMGFIVDVTEKIFVDNKMSSKEANDCSQERPQLSGQNSAENVTNIRELCPELADEIEAEGDKDPPCDKCHDNPRRKCKECGCSVCGGKNEPDNLLMCDQCEYYTHTGCANPPLEKIPEDDWYCRDCYVDKNEIVNVGEKGSKFSKKSSKMPSRQPTAKKRDWGGGLATAGRTKTCTIVPTNHFGPIPGIEVGMCWKYRIQVSEEGVHRPPVGGIAGRAEEGCVSLVLAGGFENDFDNGDEFYYTGSGGKDLSGNKRTANEQSFDQVLEKGNLAIARNCDAPVDKVKGNSAKNWKNGKPLRVVRSNKMKRSKFAPVEGNRYDGIYKVVKYWPEKSPSGFVVWRYLLRRDDPSPAPWDKRAKKFKCIYPDIENVDDDQPKKKTRKIDKDFFTVDPTLKAEMCRDEANSKLWKECLDYKAETKHEWYKKVQEVFECVVCQGLLDEPVTLPCGHNLCRGCLLRSFKAEVYSCPYCRHDLGKKFEGRINENCLKVLRVIFS